MVKGFDGVTLRDLLIQGHGTGVSFENIGDDEPFGGAVLNCTVTGNTGTGLVLYAHGTDITECTVSNNGGRGISLTSTHTEPGSMVLIERSYVQNNGGCGLRTSELGPELVVQDCVITGNHESAGDVAAGINSERGGDCRITRSATTNMETASGFTAHPVIRRLSSTITSSPVTTRWG